MEAGHPTLESIKDGLRLQLGELDRRLRDGDELTGWKVGLTSGRARDRMGVGFRPFGHLLASRTFRSGDTVPKPDGADWAVEPELVFELGEPLRGAVDADQVARAVTAVRPAFEILEFRVPGIPPHPVAVADNLANWGVVVGDPVPWTTTASQVHAELWRFDEQLASVGPGYEIDEPVESIAAVCALLDEFGLGLEPGQLLLTGSFAVEPVNAPSEWRAEFEGIGAVAIAFDDAPARGAPR